MCVTKSPAAPREQGARALHQGVTSPFRLPSAKGKSIPALTQHWADPRKKGSAASARMDGCHVPSLQIKDSRSTRGLADRKGIEHRVLWGGPVFFLWGTHFISSPSPASCCQGTKCCITQMYSAGKTLLYLMGNRSLFLGGDKRVKRSRFF